MTTEILEQPRTVRACLFTLGGERFAIEVGHAREVVVVEEYTTVPLAASSLLGVANLRGYILPLLDIRPLLGLARQPVGRGSKALVMGVGAIQVAVAIEAVHGLEWFADPIAFGDAARQQYGELGIGLLQWEGRLVTLLDAPKVMAALRMGLTAKGD
jgi:chemotaxis signal transduction protein